MMPPSMTPQDFAARWQASTLKESACAPSHVTGLCHMLGQLAPPEADPAGARYAFERGVTKAGGGSGFADVWMRGHFAWEYKGKHKDLNAAYQQLLQYHEDLENPPLLVVCDFERFEVHTKFTAAVTRTYAFTLPDLVANASTPTCDRPPLDVLRALFEDPQ